MKQPDLLRGKKGVRNVGITRVFYNQLKKRKQLKLLSFKKVLSAGFQDENNKQFVIEFDMENGQKKDLMILFEKGKPEVFISDSY